MSNTSFKRKSRPSASSSFSSSDRRGGGGGFKRNGNGGGGNSGGGRGRGGRGGGGRKVSELDPNSLIQTAKPKETRNYEPSRTFNEMPLDHRLKQRIENKGFKYPTEIQDLTLESLMEGNDLKGIAETGSGKTGAFLIPIIDRLIFNDNDHCLILVPTRELALQVETEFKSLTKGLKLYSHTLIGGTSVSRDIHELRRHHHIIIGTPGRVMDMLDRGALRLKTFTTLVLDEFDRMLDMGFVGDVNRISDDLVNRKQTILFSATENGKQRAAIDSLLKNPMEVKVSSGTSSAEHIDQDIVRIPRGKEKFDVLIEMLNREGFDRVLVFAETKRWVEKITKKLNQSGIASDEIHGNKSQNYRQRALSKFKTGKIKVLVATDVASRGIDVNDVTQVINYELPVDMESYIHRIGRTGRAGKTGAAFTLVGAN